MKIEIEIKIDGEEFPIGGDKLTVSDILKLGGKPKDRFEDFNLSILTDDGQEDVIYSKENKPKSSLNDEIPIEDGMSFRITKEGNKPSQASYYK